MIPSLYEEGQRKGMKQKKPKPSKSKPRKHGAADISPRESNVPKKNQSRTQEGKSRLDQGQRQKPGALPLTILLRSKAFDSAYCRKHFRYIHAKDGVSRPCSPTYASDQARWRTLRKVLGSQSLNCQAGEEQNCRHIVGMIYQGHI